MGALHVGRAVPLRAGAERDVPCARARRRGGGGTAAERMLSRSTGRVPIVKAREVLRRWRHVQPAHAAVRAVPRRAPRRVAAPAPAAGGAARRLLAQGWDLHVHVNGDAASTSCSTRSRRSGAHTRTRRGGSCSSTTVRARGPARPPHAARRRGFRQPVLPPRARAGLRPRGPRAGACGRSGAPRRSRPRGGSVLTALRLPDGPGLSAGARRGRGEPGGDRRRRVGTRSASARRPRAAGRDPGGGGEPRPRGRDRLDPSGNGADFTVSKRTRRASTRGASRRSASGARSSRGASTRSSEAALVSSRAEGATWRRSFRSPDAPC